MKGQANIILDHLLTISNVTCHKFFHFLKKFTESTVSSNCLLLTDLSIHLGRKDKKIAGKYRNYRKV